MWDIGIQHELLTGLAVTVSYNQRSFYNLIYTTNLAIPFSEYTLLTIADPRGNGQLLRRRNRLTPIRRYSTP